MKLTGLSRIGQLGYNLSLPLADGITVLTGDNASGKSMLASTVPKVFYDSTKPGKGSILSVSWDNGGVPGSYTVLTDKAKTAKTLWRTMEDGVVNDIRLKKDAQAWLRQRLPLSQGAFSTVNFIAALRANTILSGNPTQCNELLAEIVGLTVFESLRKALSSIYQREGVTAEVRATLERELATLSSTQTRFRVIPRLDDKVALLQDRRATMRERAERISEQLDRDRPLSRMSDAKLRETVAKGDEANALWEAYDAYVAAPKPQSLDLKRLKAARELEGMVADARSSLVWAIISGKRQAPRNPAAVIKRGRELQEEVAALETSVRHLSDSHDADNCPTCRSRINGATLLASLQRTLKTVRADSESASDAMFLAGAAEVAQEILDTLKIDGPQAVSLAADLDAMERAEKHNAKCDPDLLKVAKPHIPRVDPQLISDARDELSLRERGFVVATDKAADQYEALAGKHAMFTRYLKALTAHRDQQVEYQHGHRRTQTLRAELAKLPPTSDVDLIKEVLKALENKNARNVYLEMVGEHLVDMLNELSPIFYSYKVEFSWSNGSLIANRKGAADNVSTLSGHESRVFLLLMAMATQRCLPPNQRLRTLVLDEIEAGSQRENRIALAELLPLLLENGYDNILVVTPQSFADFPVHGRRYRVEADKTMRRVE